MADTSYDPDAIESILFFIKNQHPLEPSYFNIDTTLNQNENTSFTEDYDTKLSEKYSSTYPNKLGSKYSEKHKGPPFQAFHNSQDLSCMSDKSSILNIPSQTKKNNFHKKAPQLNFPINHLTSNNPHNRVNSHPTENNQNGITFSIDQKDSKVNISTGLHTNFNNFTSNQNNANIKKDLNHKNILIDPADYLQLSTSNNMYFNNLEALNSDYPLENLITERANQSNTTSAIFAVPQTPTTSTYSLASDNNETANLTNNTSTYSSSSSNTAVSSSQYYLHDFLSNCQFSYERILKHYLSEGHHNPQQKSLETLKTLLEDFISSITHKKVDLSPSKSPSYASTTLLKNVHHPQTQNNLNFNISGNKKFNRNSNLNKNGTNYSTPPILAHPDEFTNPSSFLKIYGDPLCGSDKLPQKGIDGNWECRDCGNVNYPRRFRCNLCNSHRDKEGDTIVSNYVSYVYEQYRTRFDTEQNVSLSKFTDDIDICTPTSQSQITHTRYPIFRKKPSNTQYQSKFFK